MFCTNCGSKLEEGTLFCPTCGKPVSKEDNNSTYQKWDVEETEVKETNTQEMEESQPAIWVEKDFDDISKDTQKAKKSLWVWKVTGALLLLAVLVLMVRGTVMHIDDMLSGKDGLMMWLEAMSALGLFACGIFYTLFEVIMPFALMKKSVKADRYLNLIRVNDEQAFMQIFNQLHSSAIKSVYQDENRNICIKGRKSAYVITIDNKIPVLNAKKSNYKTVLEQETIAGNLLKFLEPEAPINAFENERINSMLSVFKSILGILAVIFGIFLVWYGLWWQGVFGGQKYVRFVKEACPEAYPDISYGDAFDDFFGDCKWEYFKSEENQDVVEFRGNCMYEDETAEVKAQFLVSYDEGKGELYTMSLNDEIQPELVQAILLTKIFNDYGSGADTNTLELEEDLPDGINEQEPEGAGRGTPDKETEKETSQKEKNDSQIHRYELLLNDMTWTQAYNDCISRGGYLVQINSFEEYQHIIQQINGAAMQDVHFYLGGRRSRAGRDYYWINSQNEFEGDSLNPGKDSWAAGLWMKNEPSYSSDGDTEQYMSLVYYQNAWVMNDVPEDISIYYPGKTGYICEYDETETKKTTGGESGIVLTPQTDGKSAAGTSSLDFPILFQGYLEYSPCPVMIQEESGDMLRSGSYSEMLASCVDDGTTMYASPSLCKNEITLPTRWDAPNDMWYEGLLSYDQFLFVMDWMAKEHDTNGVSQLSTSANWEDVSNLSGRWNDGKRDISISVYSDWEYGQAYQEIANWTCGDDKGTIYLLGKSDKEIFVICEAENGAWMVLRYNGALVVDSVNGFDVEQGTRLNCLEHFVS